MSARRVKVDDTIEALVTTGMPKGIALTLNYLSSKGDWATSKDIEKATKLRQPEVSNAVRDLEERGWGQRDNLKRESKGRPINIYRMAVDLDQVYSSIESEERSKIEGVQRNLEQIRELWSLS